MKFFWMIVPIMLLWFESGGVPVVHAQESSSSSSSSSPDSEPTPSTQHLTKSIDKTLPMMMEIIIVAKPMIVKETADSPNAMEQPPTAVVVHTDEAVRLLATSSSSPTVQSSSAAAAVETSMIMTAPTMRMQMQMLNGHQRRLGIVMGGLAAGVAALVISWLVIMFCHKTRRGAGDGERYYKNNGVENDEYDDDLEVQRESASRDGSAGAAVGAGPVAIQTLDGFPPAYHMQDLPVLAINIGIAFSQSRRSSMASAPPAYVEPPSYGDVVVAAG